MTGTRAPLFLLSTPQGLADSTVRKVWSPDRVEVWGEMGTVGDMIGAGRMAEDKFRPDAWAFRPRGKTDPVVMLTRTGVYQYIYDNYVKNFRRHEL